MRKRNGFTLIEIVFAIAIIAILIMVVGFGASAARENAKVQAAAESIRSLHTAAENYIAAGNMTFTGVTVATLKTGGFLPANFNNVGANPWAGDYTVAVNASDSSKVDITLTSVSTTGATRLTTMFNNSAQAITSSSGTWTATF